MSAEDMATLTISVYRSPGAVSSIITDQEAHLSDLLMIPPMPVTSEPFLAYAMQSKRRTWETAIFADADNVLPDVGDGDKITDGSAWYIVRGVQAWTRPGDLSFLSILLDEVTVSA